MHEQSGRTTRMIEHAKQLARQARAVYIVVASEEEAKRVRRILGDSPHGIKVEAAGALPELDWQTLKLRNAHPNCVVLVDHFVIERYFACVLEMLHRYDQ